MTDSLERFLEDLRFEVPAGLAHRAKAAAAADDRAQLANRRDINWQRQPWALALVAAVLVLAIVATLVLGARLIHPNGLVPSNPNPKALVPSDPIPPSLAANGWIAYPTDGPTPGGTDITTGSDIYLVRAGVEPRLIAGRDGGKLRNVCPAFSPDGRRLAYGVDAAAGRALVVLGVDANGVITATVRFPVPGSGSTVCPRWSLDGKRVAYLDGGSVVVRGLDGSTLAAVAGDPRVKDFGLTHPSQLLSPKGDRIATLDDNTCQLVIARPDGTAAHRIPMPNCYSSPLMWSPDGRQVLTREDASGNSFTMRAIAADSPFETVTIVSDVTTNGTRSWPDWGDISWQPVLDFSPTTLPSNGLIAVSANPNDVGGGEVGDIYIVGEGTGARRIIGADGDRLAQACPRFSPNGRWLAYGEARASDPVTTFRGVWPVSNRAVVVVGINEHGDASQPIARVILPKDPGQIACPEWSPTGRQVAFRVGSQLWVADATSGKTTVFQVTEAPWGQQGFEWSRDGSLIAVAEPGRIRVVSTDGRGSTLIPVKGATPFALGWTAGDDRITYISNDVLPDSLAGELHFVGVDGNNDTRFAPDLADPRLGFYDAVVSPDGTRVAYLQGPYPCNGLCSQDPRLLIGATDGSNVVEVSIPPGFGVSGHQWSPDGRRLLFGSNAGVVSVGVAPGSPAVVYSRGELNLEWSGSEVSWQSVFQ
jgi:Tol biopolymer transport system component